MFHSGCTRDLEALELSPAGIALRTDSPLVSLPILIQRSSLPSPRESLQLLPPTPSTPVAPAPSTPMMKLTPAPTTPMSKQARAPSSPYSPPPAPRLGTTPLLKSLQSGNVEQVRKCLVSEPEATSQLFFECEFEPALCCAIRHGCDPEILQLLLHHRADAFAYDKRGYTPMTCLASLPSEVSSTFTLVASSGMQLFFSNGTTLKSKRMRLFEAARLLIEARVDPHALDANLRLPATVASANGNHALAKFLDNYLEVQASVTLLRAHRGATPLSRLTIEVLQVIVAHLVPPNLVKWSVAYA